MNFTDLSLSARGDISGFSPFPHHVASIKAACNNTSAQDEPAHLARCLGGFITNRHEQCVLTAGVLALVFAIGLRALNAERAQQGT